MNVPPDIELAAIEFLKDHADVAALVGARVTTDQPSNPTFPLITVTGLGGVMRNRVWTFEGLVDVDCYATTREAASTLARTAYGALMQDARGWSDADVHIVNVTDVTGPQPLFDEDRTPAKPRFSFSVQIAAHPA